MFICVYEAESSKIFEDGILQKLIPILMFGVNNASGRVQMVVFLPIKL